MTDEDAVNMCVDMFGRLVDAPPDVSTLMAACELADWVMELAGRFTWPAMNVLVAVTARLRDALEAECFADQPSDALREPLHALLGILRAVQ